MSGQKRKLTLHLRNWPFPRHWGIVMARKISLPDSKRRILMSCSGTLRMGEYMAPLSLTITQCLFSMAPVWVRLSLQMLSMHDSIRLKMRRHNSLWSINRSQTHDLINRTMPPAAVHSLQRQHRQRDTLRLSPMLKLRLQTPIPATLTLTVFCPDLTCSNLAHQSIRTKKISCAATDAESVGRVANPFTHYYICHSKKMISGHWQRLWIFFGLSA